MVALEGENKMGSTREAQLDFSDAVVVWHLGACVLRMSLSAKRQRVKLTNAKPLVQHSHDNLMLHKTKR